MKLRYRLINSAEGRIGLATTTMWAFTLWFLPRLALLLAFLVLVATAAISVARVLCVLARSGAPEKRGITGEQFVSIHIATYSEPPEVVKRTLDSLARLEYSNYEVIVLDNNTPDQELYEPVRRHCEALGGKFRFYHFDGVEGAKAGALNISLQHSDPRTEYLLILDADYHAEPQLVAQGLSYFVDSTIGLVQFPQAYRNGDEHCGLTWEYKLFFDVYMQLANKLNTVLSTGTAAFVRKDSLLKAGGWSGDTLTEDAELGLRLHRYGYRGVYVPQVRAAGLMPTDLKNLRSQRRRWVLGNAQSLKALKQEEGISWIRKTAMFLQLTAWASPLLLCLVPFFLAALAFEWGGHPMSGLVACLAALSIGIYLGGLFCFFTLGVKLNGGTFGTGAKAFLVHIGMLREASLSWCEVFVESDKSFVRTEKTLSRRANGPGLSLLGSVASLAVSFALPVLGGSPFLAFATAVGSLYLLGHAFLNWNLRLIRHRTKTIRKARAPQGRPIANFRAGPGVRSLDSSSFLPRRPSGTEG